MGYKLNIICSNAGNRIWITKGLVSSFETKKYLHSDTELLRIQIDATIKDGNSGGPVILENKVVGVAYEGSQIQRYVKLVNVMMFNGGRQPLTFDLLLP